ncbi:amidohydrolase family protein [Mycobacteroides sp. LB1]|uniref:amidohydrolase family protein n=1 Tax=Mycobacteroides sp. LB1 TaxID=2750814 RepID=UPI0015DE11AD|nr:amidohydrolase [Mycobacteroides sp. LB1]
MPVRTITLEEHFLTDATIDIAKDNVSDELLQRLSDLSTRRLAAMDEAQIDVQVLSLTAPGFQNIDASVAIPRAIQCNDHLRREVIDRHPARFAGWATLPTADPDAAAHELERAVKELGFVGALINGRTQGLFLDDPRFDPILSAAMELDVPIYLHPNVPTKAVINEYYSGLNPAVSRTLGLGGLGWHQETGLHVLRLILAGVFDKYPTLKIIIGHMGEGLPFYHARIREQFLNQATHLKFSPDAYLTRNLWITTSGFGDDAVFDIARKVFGDDRIMFSVDYPFANAVEMRRWFDAAQLADDARKQMAYTTAASLLKLPT